MKKVESFLLLSIKFLRPITLLMIILIDLFCYTAKADPAEPQRVTLDLKNVSLSVLFKEMKKQTSYKFFYNDSQERGMKSISISVKNETVENVLEQVFKGSAYTCKIEGEQVIVVQRTPQKNTPSFKGINIMGLVTDEKNIPLPGVTVQLKGTTVGTATNQAGKYTLTVPAGDNIRLLFSFIGMESKEVAYNGTDTINVVLKEIPSQLEEVVIVNTGYQNIEKRKLTSAVTTIKADDILVPGMNSIDQMLEGHVPGMIFMQNSGQLGAAPRLRIRGTSTVLGNQEPLWVVDGIVQTDPVNVDPSQINDLDFVNLLGNAISGLNPEDIEQIDVLKDASATAIYGARAGNGVIVITTKKGKIGPPSVTYSFSATLTQRPHYSDKSVNMMNSRERIEISREMIEKDVQYPTIQSWVGYESVMRDYYNDRISFEEMQQEVSRLETLNTDWFDILGQNSFSHKHTIGISGGSSELRYYASVGFNDSRGITQRESNRIYTTSLRINANFNKFSVAFGINANTNNKKYTPTEVNVMGYAYHTSRAVPIANSDGSLWFYDRDSGSKSYRFNIQNEIDNSSFDIKSHNLNFNTMIGYSILENLKLDATLSYGIGSTGQETWYGRDSYYALKLRDGDSPARSELPFGDELTEDDTDKENYTVRLQLNYDQDLDKEKNHSISSSLGWEVSSSQYNSRKMVNRGYLPDRGLQMADIDLKTYTAFAKWKNEKEAKGVRKSSESNTLSAYATLSYSYKYLYMFNVNARIDRSNNFGSKANDKLAPIWSLSARWNVKEDILKSVNWVDNLSLRGSFGYQGNMLPTESSQLILEKGELNTTLNQNMSTVYRFPNPDLRWEKTASYNLQMDFSLLKNKIRGTVAYFYKKTKDAFLNKTISQINGRGSYVMNKGTVVNKGLELSFNFNPVNFQTDRNPNGFRWTIDPQLGQILNQLISNKKVKDNTLQDAVKYDDYLDGSVQIVGRPLNTFYSYRFAGLSSTDGHPLFYNTGELKNTYVDANGLPVDKEVEGAIDLEGKYDNMSRDDVFMSVMEHSGTRVPKIQGGVNTTFSWYGFTLGLNFSYSLGSKIRLLQLYPNMSTSGTIAPQPTENMRREFTRRWRNPGDELTTDIPAILYDMGKTTGAYWFDRKAYAFADNMWQMYDNSSVRVVSGNYLKLQSMSFRYRFPDRICQKMYMKSMYASFSCTNVFMICSKKLEGQDPATQSGSAPTLSTSLRPTYSFTLNVSF